MWPDEASVDFTIRPIWGLIIKLYRAAANPTAPAARDLQSLYNNIYYNISYFFFFLFFSFFLHRFSCFLRKTAVRNGSAFTILLADAHGWMRLWAYRILSHSVKIEAQTRLGIKMRRCRENVSLCRCGTIRCYLETWHRVGSISYCGSHFLCLFLRLQTMIFFFLLLRTPHFISVSFRAYFTVFVRNEVWFSGLNHEICKCEGMKMQRNQG